MSLDAGPSILANRPRSTVSVVSRADGYGLQTLHGGNLGSKGLGAADAAKGFDADIIAVHGLNGHAFRTWTEPKTGTFWLKDLLPTDIPGAKIMTFGYNASLVFGNTIASLEDHALMLLNDIRVSCRDDPDKQNSLRPLIFVAHSLGGIVVKKALLIANSNSEFRDIASRTLSIIFLGTPHRGSKLATYGRLLSLVAGAVTNTTDSRVVPALEANSDQLGRLSHDFLPLISLYRISSFFELKPLPPAKTPVVERHSAIIGCVGERLVPCDTHHRDICRFASAEDRVYRLLVDRIQEDLRIHYSNDREPGPIQQLAPSQLRSGRHYMVPFSSIGCFTGRTEVLSLLEAFFTPDMLDQTSTSHNGQRRFVLYGLGGSGKSQICLQFAEKFQDSFCGIFWIDASSTTSAETSFKQLARLAEIDSSIDACKTWLSGQTSWLLILDNADDPRLDLTQYFPSGRRGGIIITSRNPSSRSYATDDGFYLVDTMEETDAVSLLLRASFHNNVTADVYQDAKDVVNRLGCLSIAIVQTAAYIQQLNISFAKYLELWSINSHSLMAERLVVGSSAYKQSPFGAWLMSLTKIQQAAAHDEASRDAIEILFTLSYLHNESVPESLFFRAWKGWTSSFDSQTQRWSTAGSTPFVTAETTRNRFRRLIPGFKSKVLGQSLPLSQEVTVRSSVRVSMLKEKTWDYLRLRQALAVLQSYSLISTNENGATFSMHCLCHQWARECQSRESQKQWETSTASIIAMSTWSRDYRRNEASDSLFWTDMYPHVQRYLTAPISVLGGATGSCAYHVKVSLGYISEKNQDWASARGQFSCALKILEKSNPQHGNLEAVKVVHGLMLATYRLDESQLKYLTSDAEKLFLDTIELSKRDLGVDHEVTLQTRFCLAQLYVAVTRLQEAENLLLDLLEHQRRLLGGDSPEVWDTMELLAWTYTRKGCPEKSLPLLEAVLRNRQDYFGDNHNETLLCLVHTSEALRCSGDLEAGERVARQVVEARITSLGHDHYYTLQAKMGLAAALMEMGKYEDAKDLQEAVLKIQKQRYGSSHLDTLYNMTTLGRIYQALRQYELSEKFLKDALEARQAAFPDVTGDIHSVYLNLALFYKERQRWDECIDLLHRCLEGLTRATTRSHTCRMAFVVQQLNFVFSAKEDNEYAEMLEELMTRDWRKHRNNHEKAGPPSPIRGGLYLHIRTPKVYRFSSGLSPNFVLCLQSGYTDSY
ncbi:hypothetical protein QBC35DRAFT_141477 [Podospora australis]|uniref:NB-ARC domain-containing protein n=1 Tax=Podospora australis TaxID=1536484 RepID=A0AAN6WY75_9PEZI|nr:hypothetical protein QBC35DRAFT_141477 [Podospora australis]